ncbi:LysR family transcriptional regulator [Variovorax sp.]|jgi:DNA-binding transcriptional LysR family regulator|uniref:LysR family transcriptional regulator n=1 Tax=Variovorax sp. TaxID=1871043 RepID=UPI0037D9A464
MQLRQLRYFVAVAEELNFYRAAERVHVDQSPMSRTIQALEGRLNVQLFVRSRRGTRITPAGERLLIEVKDIFAHIDRAVRAVQEVDGRCRIPLRVGIADGMVQPRLSQCLAQWRELLPKTELDLRELRSLQVPDLLRREEIDVAFCFGLAVGDGVTQEAAWTDPVVVLLPAEHALATATSLTMPQVVAHPLVLCDAEVKPGFRQQTQALVDRYSDAPSIAVAASSLAQLITQVGAGFGIGLADAGHMETLARPDVVSVPLDDPAAVLTVYVAYKTPSDGKVPDAIANFLAHVKTFA